MGLGRRRNSRHGDELEVDGLCLRTPGTRDGDDFGGGGVGTLQKLLRVVAHAVM